MENDSIRTVSDNITYWKKGSFFHRLDGPAVEYPSGTKEWYVDGLRHREDGPAIECANSRHWYVNGKCHRLDGPAIEYEDKKTCWYINGVYASSHIGPWAVELGIDLKNLTNEDKFIIMMIWENFPHMK